MMDQPIARQGSRFAGALVKKIQPSGQFLSAFLIQSIILLFAGYLTAVLWSNAMGYHFETIYLFSPERLVENEIYLAMLWLCVWVATKVNKNFLRRLMPRSIWPVEPSDDESISIIEETFNKEVVYSEKEAALSNKLRVIQTIDARIARLRGRTNLMLLTAGILLIGASLIIIFAGTLTNLDVSAASNVDKLGTIMSDVEARLGKLSDLSQSLQKLNDSNISADDRTTLQKKITDIRNFDRTLPADIAGTTTLIQSEGKRLSELEDLYSKAWATEMTSAHGYNDVRYIIATAITRIGVVLVIIFLAQILIGLYRYNTKLITFYHSRRDLVQIWDGKSANLDKLQKLMAPNFDFGKESKHPLDEIIRQVIAKIPLGGSTTVQGGKATP